MQFERIHNLILLENGLEHVDFEIEKSDPLFFRAAKESHLILYRSMVEALRGTANLSITGAPKDKKRIVCYKIGNEPWFQIQKASVTGCKSAWRYGEPSVINEPSTGEDKYDASRISDHLQGFYELLAKVQTKCFMSQYVDSKPIQVHDKEMVLLEWLHEEIRNEFEHFVPKLYSVSTSDSIASSILCLELSFKLLFESRNVSPLDDMSEVEQCLNRLVKQLKQKAAQIDV